MPDHRLCRSQGGPAGLAGVPVPSSSLGPQSQPGMGQRALQQRGQRAGWPLGAAYPPGADPRDTQLYLCPWGPSGHSAECLGPLTSGADPLRGFGPALLW